VPFQWNAHCNANFDGISVPHAYGYGHGNGDTCNYAQRYTNGHSYGYIYDHA